MKRFSKVVQFGLIAGVALMPMLALALPNPTPPIQGDPVTLRTLEDIIQRVAQFLIVFGVIIAVIFIIWGGITWMAAGGNDENIEKAKTRIWNGVKGAAVVLGVGVILQTLASIINRNVFR